MKLSSELQSGVDEKDLYLKEEGGVIVQVPGQYSRVLILVSEETRRGRPR